MSDPHRDRIDELFVFLLAEAFAVVLKDWATPQEWESMRHENAIALPGDLSCASHNFCDANMAMHEAFAFLMRRGMVLEDGTPEQDFDFTLVNAAWDYAKKTYLTEGKQTS